MIDHISIGVIDFARARAFYDACLAPLGYRRMMDFDQVAGYGREHCTFWIGVAEPAPGPVPGLHIAFAAADHAAVDAFYRAALSTGGTDNGAPGLRPRYHPDYYAGFVIDPDGNKIEAVCHRPA